MRKQGGLTITVFGTLDAVKLSQTRQVSVERLLVLEPVHICSCLQIIVNLIQVPYVAPCPMLSMLPVMMRLALASLTRHSKCLINWGFSKIFFPLIHNDFLSRGGGSDSEANHILWLAMVIEKTKIHIQARARQSLKYIHHRHGGTGSDGEGIQGLSKGSGRYGFLES